MMRICIAAAIALACTTAHAQVYKCKVDGTTVFSDQPCSSDAKQISVRPAGGPSSSVSSPASAAPSPAVVNSSSNPQAVVARMEHERAIREIESKIQRLRSRVLEEQDSMNREVAALRDQKQYANNNLAGATWQQSLSGEMSAVVARYDVRIRGIEAEIERAEAEHARLRDSSKN